MCCTNTGMPITSSKSVLEVELRGFEPLTPRCELSSAARLLAVVGAGRCSVAASRSRSRLLTLLTSVLYGVRPVAAVGSVVPDRSGIGSADWKATVYRFVTTEAGVERTFAAGQSG